MTENVVPAYILIDRLSITDPAAFEPYPLLASAAVERYRGRYVLPHDMPIEALEGNWKPNRVVVIEFGDIQDARAWWESREYAQARTLHRQTTIANIILVADEGDGRRDGR